MRYFTITLLLSLAALAFSQRGGRIKDCEIDVLTLLDGSASIGGEFSIMLDFTSDLAKLLLIEPGMHHVGLLVYSSIARAEKWPRYEIGELKTNKEVEKAIREISGGRGLTYTGHALEIAIEMLKKRRRNAITIVAVISDGFSTDYKTVEEVAPKIYNRIDEDIYVFCIAVPTKFSLGGMVNISGSMDRVLHPPSVGRKLAKVLGPYLAGRDKSCGNYVPTTTTTTTTTTVTTKKPATRCEVDLLFIIDFSSSVEEAHKGYVEAAIQILEGMTISPYHTRVAMVKYSGKKHHEIVFHFNKHESFESVAAEIRSTDYLGGTTYASGALRLALTEFDPKFGARMEEATHQVAVIYTHGYSQEDGEERLAAADELRAQGIETYVVALTQPDVPPDNQQLQQLGGDDQNVFVDENEKLAQKLAGYNRNCRD